MKHEKICYEKNDLANEHVLDYRSTEDGKRRVVEIVIHKRGRTTSWNLEMHRTELQR